MVSLSNTRKVAQESSSMLENTELKSRESGINHITVDTVVPKRRGYIENVE